MSATKALSPGMFPPGEEYKIGGKRFQKQEVFNTL